ncbi:hypothetical protein C3L33_09128, partial [Rhododendron williamsianum]
MYYLLFVLACRFYFSIINGVSFFVGYTGFDVTSARKSCCGIGGPYDFTLTLLCGFPGVPVCSQPNRYIHWDGIHLTQEAYRLMAG